MKEKLTSQFRVSTLITFNEWPNSAGKSPAFQCTRQTMITELGFVSNSPPRFARVLNVPWVSVLFPKTIF